MLECVASIIGPWIDLTENTIQPFSFILFMTDSTTSTRWLQKSKFTDNSEEESEIHLACKIELAQDHDMRLMENEIKEYSQ